jgi:WD40 repeat protein
MDGRPTLDRDNPWPGLASFDELDSAFFHGRGAESAELLRLIAREPLTVLFGRSGLGKTSLLKAGVFPALREADLLPVYLRLDHSDGAPPLREQIWRELQAACDAARVQAPRPAPGEGLWSFFHRRDAEFWSPRNRLVMPVIVFDQFEEVFTLGQQSDAARARAAAFIAELSDLVENRPPREVKQLLEDEPDSASRFDFRRANVKLVLSFREDFLAEFEGLKTQMPSLMYNRLRLLPMNGAQAWRVVTESGGDLVDDDVARRILRLAWLNEVGEPVAREDFDRIEIDPALLSVVCSELNHKRRHAAPPLPRITAGLLAGADREILAGFYERAMEGLAPQARAFVEDELITDRGFRDSHDWDDALAMPGVTAQALEALVARRLLRVDERLGRRRIELTHDVLTRVVRDSRDRRRTREAEAAAAAREQAAAAQQRRNRRNALLVGSGVLVTLLLAVFTFWQGHLVREARRVADIKGREAEQLLAQARSTRLMATADGLQARQLDAALLVNLEALRESPTLDARAGLLRRFDSQRNLSAFLRAHAHEVTALAFSSDGRQLASAGEDGTLVIWDLATRQPLFKLAGPKVAVSALAFSADGHRLVAAGRTQATLTLWDLQRRAVEGTLEGHTSTVWSLAFSPDGGRLASAGTDRSILLWDVATRQRQATLQGHERTVWALAFSADGRRLASAGADPAVLVWDLGSGKPARKLTGHSGEISGLAFNADGTRLASAAGDQTAIVWDLAGNAPAQVFKGHKTAVARVAFAADGKGLVTAAVDQTVILWSLASGQAVQTLEGVKDQIARVALSADGRAMASVNADSTVLLWDLTARTARHALRGHAREVFTAAFSADSSRLATGGADRQVLVWDPAQDGKPLLTLPGHEGGVWGLGFVAGGRELASAGGDGNVMLWSVADGKALATLSGHKGRVLGLALSADGKLMASAGEDHTVILWDLPARKPLAVLQGHADFVTAVAFSPDGHRLASAGADRVVLLWDVASRKSTARLEPDQGTISGLAFSADGQTLAAATELGVVVLWDAASTAQVAVLAAHDDRVSSVAFSTDGRWLATSSVDRSVSLWDLALRQPLASFGGFAGEVNGVFFSPDGKRLLAVSDRAPAAELFDLDPATLAAQACRTANRNLGCQEWRQHVGREVPWRKTCTALPAPEPACK